MSGYRLGGNFYARVDTFSGEVVLGRERGSTKHLCLQIVCKLSNVLVTTPPSPPPPPHGRWQKVPHVEGATIWLQAIQFGAKTMTAATPPARVPNHQFMAFLAPGGIAKTTSGASFIYNAVRRDTAWMHIAQIPNICGNSDFWRDLSKQPLVIFILARRDL